MINGFQSYTCELNREEKAIFKPFIYKLLRSTNENRPMTNYYMRQWIFKEFNMRISGARVRKIINDLRLREKKHVILSTSKGYFISTNEQKIAEHIESLKQRASAIIAVANAESRALEQIINT